MSTFRLAPQLINARAARRFVEGELRRQPIGEETLFRVQLLATELVTNAVRHARSPVDLTVTRRKDRIRIEARDDCPERPTLHHVDTSTRHRGMLLVDDLAEDWGVDVHEGDGKVVWLEVCAT